MPLAFAIGAWKGWLATPLVLLVLPFLATDRLARLSAIGDAIGRGASFTVLMAVLDSREIGGRAIVVGLCFGVLTTAGHRAEEPARRWWAERRGRAQPRDDGDSELCDSGIQKPDVRA